MAPHKRRGARGPPGTFAWSVCDTVRIQRACESHGHWASVFNHTNKNEPERVTIEKCQRLVGVSVSISYHKGAAQPSGWSGFEDSGSCSCCISASHRIAEPSGFTGLFDRSQNNPLTCFLFLCGLPFFKITFKRPSSQRVPGL